MEIVKISMETLNEVLAYLSEQPYKDTAGMISKIVKQNSELNQPVDKIAEKTIADVKKGK